MPRGKKEFHGQSKNGKLRKQHERFVAAYVDTWNATKSALAAGYSQRSAGSIGHDLLKHPEIKQEINKKLKEAAITEPRVLREITEMARADITDFLIQDEKGKLILKQFTDLPAGYTRCIKKIKIKTTMAESDMGILDQYTEIELYDRLKALSKAEDMLSKVKASPNPDGDPEGNPFVDAIANGVESDWDDDEEDDEIDDDAD